MAIELNAAGIELCRIFYCDSRQSQQKGKCEKNHEHFREKVPKGTSLDNFDQTRINDISLHINNYPRPMMNSHSPYDIAKILLHEKILKLNKLYKLQLEEINLK